MKTRSIDHAPTQRLLPVRSPDELAFLVKESEILTGRRGREFVVAGADRLAYRVHADAAGFHIARVDAASAQALLATAPELAAHTLGQAMAGGQLFTEPLGH